MKFKIGEVELFSPKLKIDFMRYRKLFIGVSVILVLISLAIIAIKGINYSIDFTGGDEITVVLQEDTSTRKDIYNMVKELDIGEPVVTVISVEGRPDGSGFLIHLGGNVDAENLKGKGNAVLPRKDMVKTKIMEEFNGNVEVSAVSISAKVGQEEQLKGMLSILASLVAILFYVMIRFDARFAPGAILCLAHDVIIALGFVTLIGLDFSNTSIAAFLTLVGFSINDTIVIYDRVRETTTLNPRMPTLEVVNRSINQTMNRTVLTSLTTLVALVVLTIWGRGSIQDFAITMLVGVLVGSYSSIYVAAPLTVWLDDWLKSHGVDLNEKFNRKKHAQDPNFIPPVVVRKGLPIKQKI